MSLKQSDLLVLALFLTVSVISGLVQLANPPALTVLIWKTSDIKVLNPATSLDLNTATYEELVRFPDIDSELAERIVSYREKKGSFETLEELRHIEGVNAKLLGKLKIYLRAHTTKEE